MSGPQAVEDIGAIIRELIEERLGVIKEWLKKDIVIEGLAQSPSERLKGHVSALIDYISYKAIPQGDALKTFQASIDYLKQRDIPHARVPLAVHALATLTTYYALAPVLSPMCPNDYKSQVDALSYVLGKVLDYLRSEKAIGDIFGQLTDMIKLRLARFNDSIATCQVAVLRLDAWQGHWAGLTGPLRDYYGQLFGQVYQMANRDIYVPLALNALGSIYTHLIAGRPFAGKCPDLLQTYLKGLERITGDVVTLLHGKPINFTGDARPWLTDLLGLRLKHFLEFIAYCYGIDLRLSVEVRNGLPEVTILRVSPVRVSPEAGGDWQ